MKSASVARKGVVAKKCAIRAFFLRSLSALWAADWENEGGIHPHGDRKSAEAFEYKGVAVRPLCRRVRKKQKRKGLDVGGQNSGGKGRLA
jgi:hypothetical protein